MSKFISYSYHVMACAAMLCIIVWFMQTYRIAGNFRGVQFSRMANLQSFRSLNFADESDHAHYTLYNRTYFTGLIFHENFPLYGIKINIVLSVS
jgi:hypothetical protein